MPVLRSPVVLPWALGAVALLVYAGTDDGRDNSNSRTEVNGAFPCAVASVHDGDTFRCADGVRVRVAGIDARELDGSCAPGHPCASAPPEQATAALDRLIDGQTLTCEPNGRTYNRVAAFCRRADGVDVSCAMLASGTVARWDRYWRGHRCP
jgi:endonuclease YncB( thermonuclease family)